jgi:hypothetical protein
MAVANYGYLVLKMSSPNSVLKIRGNHDVGACALEKIQALATARKTAAEHGVQGPAPPSSHQHGLASAPRVQPSVKEDVPVKTVQIGAEADQFARISGDLDSK